MMAAGWGGKFRVVPAGLPFLSCYRNPSLVQFFLAVTGNQYPGREQFDVLSAGYRSIERREHGQNG
jgi:hypothetical protein